MFTAMHSELLAIEGNATLFEDTNFAGRSAVIDFLEFHVIDRIGVLLAQGGWQDKLKLLRKRAERIKDDLEKIDRCLLARVRAEIAAGRHRGPAFEDMIRRLLEYAEEADKRDYDVLDTFMNGLFSDLPMPAETKALLPDMVSFHKTPVRVVFELVKVAEMDNTDIFFDIGSGLGQVVLLVNLITGATARGIEYEPAYCAYANAIAARLHLTDTTFINADALEGDYSAGTVFFLYTPFEGKMLRDMLELLRQASHGRPVRIVTYGPCSVTVAAQNWCQCIAGSPGDPYQLCLFLRC